MSQFGSEALRLSRENEPCVVHDAEEDGRVSGADLEAYRLTSIRAVISAPLHKGGRFVAGMAVHQKTPRRWTSEEVGLLAAVANRFWESIERARAARALRQSEEPYRNVVEQAAESIFLLDLESLRVLEANAALGAPLGYASEELRGMSIYDISAHDRKSVDNNVERALREGRLPLGLRQYRRKDGGLVDVEISISTVPYEDRQAMCVVAHDVTGRLRAERALGEIRDAERNRIARELYDSILQDIVYALQEIQILQVTGRNGDDSSALGDAADALRRSVEGLRGAIFELRLEQTLEAPSSSRWRTSWTSTAAWPVGPTRSSWWSGRARLRGCPGARDRAHRSGGAHQRPAPLGGSARQGGARRQGGRALRRGPRRRARLRPRAHPGGEIELWGEPGRGTRVLCRVPLPTEDRPKERDF
jgi:PAS domain S-box-containing protein